MHFLRFIFIALFLIAAVHADSAELLPVLKQRFFDANGDPLAGGKLYSYEAGTTTPKATYTDRGGATANANPVILDANGEASVWIGTGYYKFVLKDSSDVTQFTIDQAATPSEAALASAFYRGVINITSSDSPYTLDQDDNGYLINIDTTSGSVTVNLPEISSLTLPYNVAVKKTVSSNTVTINRAGTDTIDGATSKTLETANAAAQFVGSIAESPDDWSVIDQGTVADGAVTTAKLATGAVTASKRVKTTASKTGAYTLTSSDDVILCSSASFTLTLPTAVGITGREYTIIHNGTSLTQVYTIDGNGSETIAGSTTYGLYTNGETVKIMSDGSNWVVVEHKTATEWTNAGALTITGTTSDPTKSSTVVDDKFWWRRVGDSAECRIEYSQTSNASGAAGSGDYLFGMPSGLNIDTNKLTVYATVEGWNSGVAKANGLGNVYLGGPTAATGSGIVVPYDATKFRLFVHDTGNTGGVVGSLGYPLNLAGGVFFSAHFMVPISGWKP